MEFAILVLVFLGIGYGLDRLFDTKPVFMIILVMFSIFGQFASLYYSYETRMKALEDDRANRSKGGPARPAAASLNGAAQSRAAQS